MSYFGLKKDRATQASTTIDYAHHEIHSGSHYFIDGVQDLSLNNVFDMVFVTPNTAKWSHFTFELGCQSQTSWYIYEGAVITNALPDVTAYNNDRNSSKTTGNTITGKVQAKLSDADTDTDVTGAILIASGILGAGKDGGVTGRDNEIILAQNETYCFRAVATVAGFISYKCSWYEHTNIN